MPGAPGLTVALEPTDGVGDTARITRRVSVEVCVRYSPDEGETEIRVSEKESLMRESWMGMTVLKMTEAKKTWA